MRHFIETRSASAAVCWLLAAASAAAAAALPERLAAWKNEIEKRGAAVILVRLETDPESRQLRIPPETPRRFLLARLLADERVRDQFRGMYAMTLNYRAGGEAAHFVLLNAARAAEFQGAEESLLAHEFGHVWLDALGFRSLDALGEEHPCLATHASDLVQHILIRRELETRGIPYREQWTGSLALALDALGKGPPAPAAGVCDTLARIAVWADARVGLKAEFWNRYNEFDAAYRRHFPDLAPAVDELTAVLTAVDVTEPGRYGRALAYVRKRLAVTAGIEPDPAAPHRAPSL